METKLKPLTWRKVCPKRVKQLAESVGYGNPQRGHTKKTECTE